ncbi:MAG: divalent-cation tolerance protein CutA [Candidatus Methanomethylicota archaeon]|uniref:Divalent-cation tolerance protein CutA n=1 Tax=Thermoproteota archaeon TaxID=2056631 RepID=A0A497EUA4_9CREN|nr:MAG: divalent-cation tolerance protein CutA [Candidatus Verstraetearchaeota archaeon]
MVVLITTKDFEEAEKIAKMLVERKLVACVNIIPSVKSYFWWQGAFDTATEALLIAKSEVRLLEQICETVKASHSYTVPEIIALPIIGGNRSYLDWVAQSLKS